MRLRENPDLLAVTCFSMDKETVPEVVSRLCLVYTSVEGWDRPGFSLGMDEWLKENQPPRKKVPSHSPFVAPTGFYQSTRFAKLVDASIFYFARGCQRSDTVVDRAEYSVGHEKL